MELEGRVGPGQAEQHLGRKPMTNSEVGGQGAPNDTQKSKFKSTLSLEPSTPPTHTQEPELCPWRRGLALLPGLTTAETL